MFTGCFLDGFIILRPSQLGLSASHAVRVLTLYALHAFSSFSSFQLAGVVHDISELIGLHDGLLCGMTGLRIIGLRILFSSITRHRLRRPLSKKRERTPQFFRTGRIDQSNSTSWTPCFLWFPEPRNRETSGSLFCSLVFAAGNEPVKNILETLGSFEA